MRLHGCSPRGRHGDLCLFVSNMFFRTRTLCSLSSLPATLFAAAMAPRECQHRRGRRWFRQQGRRLEESADRAHDCSTAVLIDVAKPSWWHVQLSSPNQLRAMTRAADEVARFNPERHVRVFRCIPTFAAQGFKIRVVPCFEITARMYLHT